MAEFDFLVVGAGPFGCAFARRATDLGKSCLVMDKRGHVAGAAYDYRQHGINVHAYGAHIFHTNDERVWEFVNQFALFLPYEHRVIARNAGRVFSMPISLRTISQVFPGLDTPAKAAEFIQAGLKQQSGDTPPADNLEQHCIAMIGRELFELAIQGYTEKQWGKPCRELPSSIIKRLPVRFTWDDRYFTDRYQGLPGNGYTSMFIGMLDGIRVELGTDYLSNREAFRRLAKQVVFTGPIDAYFGYSLGALEYRSLQFETWQGRGDVQGCPVMNHTGRDVPHTRTYEWKHFERLTVAHTLVTTEIPQAYDHRDATRSPFYPVRDSKNVALFHDYDQLAMQERGAHFGGRLGSYLYQDMHQFIAAALRLADRLCGANGVDHA